MVMEKLGVEETPENDKTAASKGTCPECGSALDPNSTVRKCPTHGTKPFEPKESPNAASDKKEN